MVRVAEDIERAEKALRAEVADAAAAAGADSAQERARAEAALAVDDERMTQLMQW